MKCEDLKRAVFAGADAVISREIELCELDSFVGDGDHGITVRKGYQKVESAINEQNPDTPSGLILSAGMGLADVTCRRLYDKIDFEQTYPNSITNTVTEVAKIPMVLYNDRQAIQMALKSCNFIDRKRPRVVRIVNTMELRYMWISEGLLPLAEANPRVTVLGRPAPIAFDADGNLTDLNHIHP